MRKGGIGAVYLFAQYLRDQVDGQANDAAKVAEFDRVLKLLLADHLLVPALSWKALVLTESQHWLASRLPTRPAAGSAKQGARSWQF